jgi:hypothetical protein
MTHLQTHQLLQFDPRLHGAICVGPNRQKGGSIYATAGGWLLQCHVKFSEHYNSHHKQTRAELFCTIEQGVEYGRTEGTRGIVVGH